PSRPVPPRWAFRRPGPPGSPNVRGRGPDRRPANTLLQADAPQEQHLQRHIEDLPLTNIRANPMACGGRRPIAGGRGGKERAASLRAERRLAPGGAAPPPRTRDTRHATRDTRHATRDTHESHETIRRLSTRRRSTCRGWRSSAV